MYISLGNKNIVQSFLKESYLENKKIDFKKFILKLYTKMIGYHVVTFDKDTSYMLILDVNENDITDYNREDIVDKKYATFNCKDINIIRVEDLHGNVVVQPNYIFNVNNYIKINLNKEVAKSNYLNKIENGILKKYYDNGQLSSEAVYVDGTVNGLYNIYYQNGVKWMEYTMVNSQINGLLRAWYNNGSRMSQALYKDGRRNGITINYYMNGNIHEIIPYVNGLRHGEYTRWYENCIPFIICDYNNGRLNGNPTIYDDKNNIVSKTDHLYKVVVEEII